MECGAGRTGAAAKTTVVRTRAARIGLAAALLLLAVGCGGPRVATAQSALAAGKRLAAKIIDAPGGYVADTTPGANGSMTPAIFTADGGARDAAKAGFVAGFTQNYVNPASKEGLAVTVIQFTSSAEASSYLEATAPHTLHAVDATITPYRSVPGAYLAHGTIADEGASSDAVVLSRGPYYASVTYLAEAGATLPVEFKGWVEQEYSLL